MAYGYRLNVEDIFLKHADECWIRAEKNMVLVKDEDAPTAKDISFIGPRSEECVSDCVLAVTGWAICLEAYVNLAWNTDIQTKDLKDELRSESTYNKIKYILRVNDIDRSDKNWLAGIKQLFETRHYFCFATSKIRFNPSLLSFRNYHINWECPYSSSRVR